METAKLFSLNCTPLRFNRSVTLLTLFIHWVHTVLLCVCYVNYIQNQYDTLGSTICGAYLAFFIISNITFYGVVSVYYMWAYRFPEPEEVSKRRRITGVIINLLICDLPIFLIEVQIVWNVQFEAPIQGLSFVWTCLSFFYSSVRFWTYMMVRVIKFNDRSHQAVKQGGPGSVRGGASVRAPSPMRGPAPSVQFGGGTGVALFPPPPVPRPGGSPRGAMYAPGPIAANPFNSFPAAGGII
eukprot:TRINITY_DN80519_c0_g1_i1.p1 TRINITY_DN80519_c0_g1~~TRINITY_DN80519_c0_g1_i1.p1  ORF type:complete len:240 (-),score=25.35 TRINITY_DN80519_c0_g1_i1:102-821(-)